MIRPAETPDVAAIVRIVRRAYEKYIARIGREPGPMGDDYAARVAAGEAFVCEDEGGIAGLVVLVEKSGYLLLDNIAIAPERQGKGLGRILLAFAETEARRRGFSELRLYTHVLMQENIALYQKLGWQEYARGEEAGFARVFMQKPILINRRAGTDRPRRARPASRPEARQAAGSRRRDSVEGLFVLDDADGGIVA